MSFDELKDLLKKWPKAVDKDLICNVADEQQKSERSKNIVNQFILTNLEGKKFLDYGCGEGHSVSHAINAGAISAVGYDTVASGSQTWDAAESSLSTDFNKIIEKGPFDVILMYDVLDHVENPGECLKNIKQVCHKDTVIWVMVHPWCSRHGTHLYHKFNYAFAHLAFSKEELASLGVEANDLSQKIVKPIATYKHWFTTNGFKIKKHEIIRDPVEAFFKNNHIVRKRITKAINEQDTSFSDFPQFQLEQSFHEFELTI